MSFQSLGQPINTQAGNVANQVTGAVALGLLATTVENTYTITNSNITANSIILVSIFNEGGSATTHVQYAADVRSVSAGSAVVHVTNLGATTGAGTWTLWYFIIN